MHPLSNAFHPKANCGESLRARRLLSSAVGKPLTVNKNNDRASFDREEAINSLGTSESRSAKVVYGKPEGAPTQIIVA